jgi:ABC-2 type transport system ATP-binding protein
VLIDGHDILEEPEKAKQHIGYLPEMPPLYMDMTVMEYMKFVADLKKIPKSQKASMIEEIMDRVKISDMKNRLIKNLSKGYKQRVGLAQALMGYPEVIILDEPTVGLDPKQIIEIRSLIRDLKEKHTVILSSHILSEVSAVCDYVMIISHGKLVASDTPENLGKLAEGSKSLNLLVKGEKPQISNIISNISGAEIRSMEYNDNEQAWNLELSMEENTDIRETLFYRFAEQKCPILEMKLKKASLEEIFLELTENEKEDAKELEDSKKGKKEEFVDPEDISDEEETSSDLEEKQEEVEE